MCFVPHRGFGGRAARTAQPTERGVEPGVPESQCHTCHPDMSFDPLPALAEGADVANEQPERWNGLVQQDGNPGRTDVLVGGGLTYPVGRVPLGLTVRGPV
ncbi:hypothetical protein [Pyxidicoccus sp. MSG2]|uniref:hypothetical protein n=1 Tax=Pyxidicoccus sp. MSG2 TaxID=2996790 RepID=UPI00226E0A1C|nr:hypothetical protein [Pyxidicoccus sp. MSG2]MCY1018372.1 hypothetical protein [Pyxidicoccus sp. MSG2]